METAIDDGKTITDHFQLWWAFLAPVSNLGVLPCPNNSGLNSLAEKGAIDSVPYKSRFLFAVARTICLIVWITYQNLADLVTIFSAF